MLPENNPSYTVSRNERPTPDHFCWEVSYIFDACLDWKRVTLDCTTRDFVMPVQLSGF